MDRTRLTRGEMLAAIAGLTLMIISVIPLWGSVSVAEDEGFSFNGSDDSFSLWETGIFGMLPKLAVLLGLAAVVLVLIKTLAVTRPTPPVTYVALGVTATLLMLMGVAVGPIIQGASFVSAGIEVTRGPLLYAGAVLCALILFGGWLHLRSEDTDFGDRSAAPPPM